VAEVDGPEVGGDPGEARAPARADRDVLGGSGDNR